MLRDYEFWFVVGSQFLYGPEVLEAVAARAQEMTDKLNAGGNLPCRLVYSRSIGFRLGLYPSALNCFKGRRPKDVPAFIRYA